VIAAVERIAVAPEAADHTVFAAHDASRELAHAREDSPASGRTASDRVVE